MEQLFTVKRLKEFVPATHPLRPTRVMINEALVRLDRLYAGHAGTLAHQLRVYFTPKVRGGIH